jgi:mRNA interferase RelE/StbE
MRSSAPAGKKIVLTKLAKKDLDSLETPLYERIITRLKSLKNNPIPQGVIKLKNREGFRLRVGDYRVLYKVGKEEIILLRVGHRREIYKL